MSALQPTRENLERVAAALKQGEVAVLPTETVYGLAADASNIEAVQRIFEVKKRPSNNPLIVHVSSVDQIGNYASVVPDSAIRLAEAFMPGPLTLVLPKKPYVPDIVTGGLQTVAIRMPDHPVCLAVMDLGELALAMPSANPFMGLSPTNVEMIDPSIVDQVFAVVDGGACAFGIESTVLDLTGEPTILRPGSITQQDIEDVLHQKVSDRNDGQRKSPGMYRRHYSPRTPCTLVSTVGPTDTGLVFHSDNENQIQMPEDPKEYARLLYAALADLDSRGLPAISIERPPESSAWAAVWDRLIKATTQ